LCPNELEAAELVGRPLETMDGLKSATLELHRRGAKRVAVTLGAEGTLVYSDGEFSHVPAFAVDAIDTTAAGDAFAGALAVYWVESDDLKYAVRFANASGAIAASRKGAQASMGDRDEIESMLKK
jgi:ribokinase